MNESEPLVSILMPYYKLGSFLQQAVESVKNQTYANWQLIVVDDCSPEQPANEILAGESDQRIRIIRNKENMGCSASRNLAAAQSNGEYLIPLDGDDMLAPTYIEKTVRGAQEIGASAAYTHVQYFGDAGREKIYVPSIDLGEIFYGHFPCNTLLIKREAFESTGGYKSLDLIEDTEFWISVIETGVKFACVPEPLYLYRTHKDGAMHTKRRFALKYFYEVLLMHHQSVAVHLDVLLEKWCELAASASHEDAKQLYLRQSSPHSDSARLNSDFEHLQTEMTALRHRYQELEERVLRNERILASLPAMARQASYIALKKVGMR